MLNYSKIIRLENNAWQSRYVLRVELLWEPAKGLGVVEKAIPEWEDGGGMRLELHEFSGRNDSSQCFHSA